MDAEEQDKMELVITETAASADGFQAEPSTPALHFMEQGHQNARTRTCDGVTQRDPRAIHVDPCVVLLPKAHLLYVSQYLGGKGLLDLNQIDLFDGQVGTF